MSDFKAKMYQTQFRLGRCPRPRWDLQRSPRPPSWIKGPTSKARRGDWKGRGKEEGGDGKGEGSGGDESPPLHAPLIHISGYAPASVSTKQWGHYRKLIEWEVVVGSYFCNVVYAQ